MTSKLKSSSSPSSRLSRNPTRLRKPPCFSANTTISSYDRTDPFTALNTLLKLFSSLSSRIGTCHLKLTPSEQKLSLHLLSIVEPFVGLAPCRRSITRQPTEILDAIAFHIDAPSDLLSLALSCKRLHDIVNPRHLSYRVVRCKPSSVSVWNHLATHRSLAQNVRYLIVIDERCSAGELKLPDGVLGTSDTDLESTDDGLGLHAKHERYMVSALARLSALNAFTWTCNHSPVAIDQIWRMLQRCKTLKEVQISDNLLFAGQVDATDSDDEVSTTTGGSAAARPSTALLGSNVRSVALRSTRHPYGAAKHPNLARVQGMLHQCPNLETLEIAYIPPKISMHTVPQLDELMLLGRWPRLTHLYLTDLRCSTLGLSALASFLSLHRALQVLHLDIAGPTANSLPCISLPPNTLPLLTEIKSNKRALLNALLVCPADAPRPLCTVRGLRLHGLGNNGNREEAVFLKNLKIHGRGIRRVELAAWTDLEDIRRLCTSLPSITWLDLANKAGVGSSLSCGNGKEGLGGKTSTSSAGAASAPVVNAIEWANVLTLLPELTTVHGMRFFYEVAAASSAASIPASSTSAPAANAAAMSMGDRSRMRKNDEVASTLAWKCPRLRRVDHWEGGGEKVIVLLKDGDRVRWEVRKVKQ
ncbi:hypothetical protein BDN71DRAFT_1453680 [Pleurotus eryngii]|uniref:F-box domain-containing protein n=1 Tax=Pleurotus eryngii TaxID=5323 RepID=A0A9P5ZND5_PLEER|nr:hypothetical protein BDN71DRAFT_1453680 [Pleurotus eryngii]